MYYVETITQLDTLMSAVFASKQLLDIGYTNLPSEDKLSYLCQSEDFIDDISSRQYNCPALTDYQEHAFPRKLGTRVIEKTDNRVQKAIAWVLHDIVKYSTNERKKLMEQGVKSINLGGVSESFRDIEDLEVISDKYMQFLGFCMIQGCL